MAVLPESDNWYGRGFGKGTLVGDKNNKYFFPPYSTTPAFIAIELAWSNGCPQARSLIDKDPKWMMLRYAETNFWFGYILQTTQRLNPGLYNQLANPTYRKYDEPVGRFEASSVPPSHETQISPMSGLPGYALPRILIEIIGRDEHRSQKRMIDALHIFDFCVRESESSTPVELLAKLSNSATHYGVDKDIILHHVLPNGIFIEENCKETFSEFAKLLGLFSPSLYEHYLQMSPTKRNELELIPGIL